MGGVGYPDDPKQVLWERLLDELVEAGYKWFELGPYGYLPTNLTRLAAEVGRRGLGNPPVGAARCPPQEECLGARPGRGPQGGKPCPAQWGARYLIYLPEPYRDVQGRFTDKRTLDDDDWDCLTRQMSEIGRIVSEDYGVSLVFHPHADSHIGTQEEEIDRFLQETEPSTVSAILTPATSHIAALTTGRLLTGSRGEGVFQYVHLKQGHPTVLAQVQANDLCFAEAVRLGVMCSNRLVVSPRWAL